jgi:ankyrin repeat protein
MNICNSKDACLPVIRICQDSEDPTDALFLYFGVVAAVLFIISLCASIVLFFQGNYFHMYKWSNIFCCGSPIIHPMCLKDILITREWQIEKKEMVKMDSILYSANIDLYNQKNRIDEESCMSEILMPDVEKPTFLKIKLELARKAPKKISNQDWFISPLHNSVRNDSYILYCVLSLLGASFDAKNEEEKSVHKELLETLDNDSKNFNEVNGFVKWWILKQTDQHWLKLVRIAAVKGLENSLNILIENKSDMSAWSYEDGNTALHFASHRYQEIVQKLISKNADVNAKNFHGETPLHISAYRQDLIIMQLLIKENANVNAKDSNGHAPLHIAATFVTIECLKFLVENGANVNEENNSKARPIHLVNCSLWNTEQVEECIKFLIEEGAEINANDKENNTPLHYAAKSLVTEQKKYCQIFIEAGADLTAKNNDGDTPLHLAAKTHSIATLNYLLEAGAKVIVNEENNDKQTFLHCYVESTWRLSDEVEDKIVKFFEILIESGADLSAQDRNGNTPLHLAATKCNIVILKCLLEHGANVNENVKNNDKQTALHCVFTSDPFLSFSQDIVGCLKVLKDAGAEINAKDKDNNTPLHLAVKSDFSNEEKEKCCQFLIASGADLSAKNGRGKTPLDHKFLKKLKRKNPELFKITLPEIC